MRILCISQWYVPEPNGRAHAVASGLAAFGNDVTTVTGYPNFPLGRIYDGYHQKLWEKEERDGVHIFRFPLYPDHTKSTLKRSLNYLSFPLSAAILAPFFVKSFDVMWVYHPPITIGIPALWIRLLKGNRPFILEVADMWPESVSQSGMMSNRLIIWLLASFAKVLYRRAAAICVVTPGFKQNLIAKGVPEEKIHVINHWANDEALFRPIPRDSAYGTQYQLADHFNVMYAGIIGQAQRLDIVLDVAVQLKALPKIQFVLIGDGISLADLKARAAAEKLSNVRFIDWQPTEKLPQFFSWADALLVQLKNDPLYQITIPSKTMLYLASGRPIICAVPGDGAEVIRQANAGLICAPEDPSALANAVLDLYNLPAEERELLGSNRQAYLAQYTKDTLMKKYAALFDDVLQRHG